MLTFQEKIEKWYPEICSNIYCGASVPFEWEDIVVDALEELRNAPISIAQIKSKFGGLRIYYDFTSGMFNFAEEDQLETVIECQDIVSKAEQAISALEEELELLSERKLR